MANRLIASDWANLEISIGFYEVKHWVLENVKMEFRQAPPMAVSDGLLVMALDDDIPRVQQCRVAVAAAVF